MVALLGALLLAPSAVLLKIILIDLDPLLVNALRFALAALVALPWTLRLLPVLRGKTGKAVLWACVPLAVSATCMVLAVTYGPASYIATLQLLAPLLLVWYSKKIISEKINRRLAMGLSLAALGATVMTLLPIAFAQQGHFVFYPLATLFGLVNIIFYPFATVEFRRVNEELKIPLMGLFGFSALVISIASFLLWAGLGADMPKAVRVQDIAILLYFGLFVSLFSKLLNVFCYERIGSAAIGIVTYFGSLLAIVLPVVILHETISVEVALGGCLIFAGLVLAEAQDPTYHKFRHFFHNH